jgi:hypothetical protein
MKATYVQLLFILLCLLFGVRFANAQGCRLDYTPNYAIYENESTDGTNIYTSVLVDGSTTGSPSAGCDYPNAQHTPMAYNVTGSTGGWLTGTPGYMTSYLSVQNNQEVPGAPGIIYLDADGEVICSVLETSWIGDLARSVLALRQQHIGDPHPFFPMGTVTGPSLHVLITLSQRANLLIPQPGSSLHRLVVQITHADHILWSTCEFAVGFAATGGGPCS